MAGHGGSILSALPALGNRLESDTGRKANRDAVICQSPVRWAKSERALAVT